MQLPGVICRVLVRPVLQHDAALHDGAAEEALRVRGEHVRHDRRGAGTLAEYRNLETLTVRVIISQPTYSYLLWIAAERTNVVPHPLQSHLLVPEQLVSRCAVVARR